MCCLIPSVYVCVCVELEGGLCQKFIQKKKNKKTLQLKRCKNVSNVTTSHPGLGLATAFVCKSPPPQKKIPSVLSDERWYSNDSHTAAT